MIVVHENLPQEALRIAGTLAKVYGLSSLVDRADLGYLFKPIEKFDGFWLSGEELWTFMNSKYKDKQTIVITPRDIYASDISQNDDWVFGYALGNLMVASTARMKRHDSNPSRSLEVAEDTYMRRLEALAVHEVGHTACRAPHHQQATWVNTRTGHELELGPHCTDNKCVMYEVVSVEDPSPSEGYLRLGTEKKYDAGLDSTISRMHEKWFCDPCLAHINIDESFR